MTKAEEEKEAERLRAPESTALEGTARDGPKGISRVYGYGPIPKRQNGLGSRWSVGGLKGQPVLWSEGLSPFAGAHKLGDELTLTVGVPEVAGYTLHRGTGGYRGGSVSCVYRAGLINVHLYREALGELMGPDGEYPAMVVASLPLRGAPVTTVAAATEVEDPMKPADDLVVETTKLVKRFRQVILYGPPGTGKTRLARQVALSLLDPARATTDILEDSDLLGDALKAFSGEPEHSFDLVVFHPSYEYEQFIGGITPKISGGTLEYAFEEGIFLRLCNAKPAAVLVIDEINRGNLSKLLGELVYALEYRGSEVTLPFPRQSGPEKGLRILKVPKELFVIATMNSSDRSIGHIDVAVRRRFIFKRIKPDPEVVRTIWQKRCGADGEALAEQLVELMTDINKRLSNNAGHDGVELGVGQSYFLPGDDDEDVSFQEAEKVVQNRWKYQVHPLLVEYEVMGGKPLPEHLMHEDLATVLQELRERRQAAATS